MAFIKQQTQTRIGKKNSSRINVWQLYLRTTFSSTMYELYTYPSSYWYFLGTKTSIDQTAIVVLCTLYY